MTIREATAEDVDALVSMGQRFLGSVYAQKIRANAQALRQLSVGLIASPDAVVYVAEVHGALIGMMGLMRYVHPMSGELTASEVMWWVDPERRGGGVRLFRIGEAWAEATGATVIQMIAPSPEVERFYQRVGYEPVERTFQRRMS